MKAYDVKKDSISLSWQPPEYDGGSPLTGYIIEKFDNKVGGWIRATRLTPDVTDYTLMGLSRRHNYNFRVYAENKLGASQPIELAELVMAKSAIGNLNYYQQIFLSISKLDGNLVIVFSVCHNDDSICRITSPVLCF